MRYFSNVIRFGLPYLRRYWLRLVFGILLGIVFGLSNAGILGFSKALLNRVFPEEPAAEIAAAPNPGNPPREGLLQWAHEKGESLKATLGEKVDPWLPAAGRPLDALQITGILIIFPFLFAFRGYIGYLSSYCMGWVSERVVNDLRHDVFRKLSSLSLNFFNRSRVGDLLTHVHGDTTALQKTLNVGVGDLVKEPITILSTFVLLLWIDWQLTLFVFIFMPLCLIPMAVLGRKARRASKGNTQTSISQYNLLVEFVSSIRVVKAYNMEQEQTHRFSKYSRNLVHHAMKGLQAKELINPLIETIGALGLGILLLYILKAGKSGADLAIFIGAVATVYTPIKRLGNLHVLFQQTSVGVDRLLKILSEQPSVREPSSPKSFSTFQREIRFENVSFSYGDAQVLTNFSLAIPRGMKLGVAGESGSGKSTLINLLFRFYDPTSGSITVDGLDIREISATALRAQLALVSQEVVLFDASVAENIACGRPGATQAEVEAAAKAAFAHDFISATPQGYQTRVGERGVMLSGGQRQRISIARAFLRQAPILALDEATAALDAEAEAEVQAAIDLLARERTVLCVAHRLATLSNMDEIIFVSKGTIIERGSFEELLRKNGAFASMARRQGLALGTHLGHGVKTPELVR